MYRPLQCNYFLLPQLSPRERLGHGALSQPWFRQDIRLSRLSKPVLRPPSVFTSISSLNITLQDQHRNDNGYNITVHEMFPSLRRVLSGTAAFGGLGFLGFLGAKMFDPQQRQISAIEHQRAIMVWQVQSPDYRTLYWMKLQAKKEGQ